MNNSVAIIKVSECSPNGKTEEVNMTPDDKSDEGNAIEDARYWNSLYTLVALGACILNASFVILIPRQNTIVYQEYWYQGLQNLIFGVAIRYSIYTIVLLFFFTKEHYFITMAYFSRIFLMYAVSFIIFFCGIYSIWTVQLGYNHPLPYIGLLVVIIDLLVNCVGFWPLMPSALRRQDQLKKQVKAYVLISIWYFFQDVPIELMSLVAVTRLQWTISLLIPMCKTLSTRIAQKIAQKFAESNNEDIEFVATTLFTMNYTTFATARLSSLNQSTVYGILTVDMIFHIFGCYQIIKQHNHVGGAIATESNATMKRKVRYLVMSEFTEAIYPLAFGITFTMAYYGPNASLFRNIGNGYFGGEKLRGVEHFYTVMLQMLCFDLGAMIISGVSLNYLCKINLFQDFCNMMRKYWLIFCIKLPSITLSIAADDINNGFDPTGEFTWITEEGRLSLICNADELSNEEKSFLLGNSTLC